MSTRERETTLTATERRRRRYDPMACGTCGGTKVPRLVAPSRPVVEGGPLGADMPVRLACPACE